MFDVIVREDPEDEYAELDDDDSERKRLKLQCLTGPNVVITFMWLECDVLPVCIWDGVLSRSRGWQDK